MSDLRDAVQTLEVLSAEQQEAIREAIVQRLSDSSGDVQAIACNCLGSLVHKFAVDHSVKVVTHLGSLSIQGDAAAKDIYIQGLRTVVKQLSGDTGGQVANCLAPIALKGFADVDLNIDHRIALLGILGDLVQTYGEDISTIHTDLMRELLDALDGTQSDLRAEIGVVLGYFAAVVSEKDFEMMIRRILSQCKGMQMKRLELQSYIHALSCIVSCSAVQTAPFLPEIVPLLESFCNVDKPSDVSDIESSFVQLRESCLLGLSSLVRSCPGEIDPFVSRIIHIATSLLSHDPQYSGEVMEDEEEGWGDEHGEWDEEEFAREVDEDSDDTWKVRLAALKVVESFVCSKKEALSDYFQHLFALLKERFSEHDLKVRKVVFQVFRDLLGSAVVLEHDHPSSSKRPLLYRQRSFFFMVVQEISGILDKVSHVFSSGDLVSKKGAMSIILKAIETVEWKNIQQNLSTFLPCISSAVSEGDPQLSELGLKAMHLVLKKVNPEDTSDAGVLNVYMEGIVKGLLKASKDDYSKLQKLAFDDISALMQYNARAKDTTPISSPLLIEIWEICAETASLDDLELVVKESSLLALCHCIAFSALSDGSITMNILLFRLRNKSTLIVAMKGLSLLANSDAPLNPIALAKAIQIILGLSNETEDILMQSLSTLRVIALHYKIYVCQLDSVLDYIDPILQSPDALLVQHAIFVLNALVGPQMAHPLSTAMLKKLERSILSLFTSNVMQSSTIHALLLVIPLLFTKDPSFDLIRLLKDFSSLCTAETPKSNIIAMSQCFSSILSQSSPEDIENLNSRCIQLIAPNAPLKSKPLSLLIIGELGLKRHLFSIKDAKEHILPHFLSSDETVRWAASICLGNLGSGLPSETIPFILERIHDASDVSLSIDFLSALKQLVNNMMFQLSGEFLTSIVQSLLSIAETEDEAIQKISAECLGRLALSNPSFVFPEIKKALRNTSKRLVMLAALPFTISFQQYSILDAEEDVDIDLSAFFSLISDSDLQTAKQALISLETISASHPLFLEQFSSGELESQWIPLIYQQTKPREDLVREVDFGGFKEKQDLHLPVRRAAFSCLLSLLKNFPRRLDLSEFIAVIKMGVKDHKEIQLMVFSMLDFLADQHCSTLVRELDQLPAAFLPGVKEQLKNAKMKDNREAMEMLEEFVRIMVKLSKLPKARQCEGFSKFNRQVLKTEILKPFLQMYQ